MEKAHRMKAQMFIVTIVFLVGLIFTVQQSLFQYSFLDLPMHSERNDYYIFSNVKDAVIDAVTSASTCQEAEKNMEELVSFLGEWIIGYIVDIEQSVDCANWENEPSEPSPVTIAIKIKSEETETTEKFKIYRSGAISHFYMLKCSVKTDCDTGETDVLHISSMFNAHAELPGQSNYPFKVCCSGPVSLDTSCSGDYVNFLDLYSETNSHVEIPGGGGGYLNDACMSVSGAQIECSYEPSCGGDSACVISISDNTNAHIGRCKAYSTKICCQVT